MIYRNVNGSSRSGEWFTRSTLTRRFIEPFGYTLLVRSRITQDIHGVLAPELPVLVEGILSVRLRELLVVFDHRSLTQMEMGGHRRRVGG